MNTERIKEIQQGTAYPNNISVQQALLKVWNECEQEKAVNKNDLLPDVPNRALLLKIQKLEAENKLLAFMVENGLGEQDVLNDITYPHEL